jgi:DnaK suppressor protein
MAPLSETRYAELRRNLEQHRQELRKELQAKVRIRQREAVTGERAPGRVSTDDTEQAADDSGEDLELALLQLKSRTLGRVNDALLRLDEGGYGSCVDCGDEIAENRLKALPFAVRCKDCEESIELQEEAEARRSTSASIYL